jgi:hypothetical protein
VLEELKQGFQKGKSLSRTGMFMLAGPLALEAASTSTRGDSFVHGRVPSIVFHHHLSWLEEWDPQETGFLSCNAVSALRNYALGPFCKSAGMTKSQAAMRSGLSAGVLSWATSTVDFS